MVMSALRILFMGSPSMALPSLEALCQSDHEVVGVVTQPDKPAGRGRHLTPPPVAQFARDKGLPLFQPEKVKGNAEFLEILKNLRPDVIAVVAYGRILPKEILDLPPLKCVNVHFSLLPKYRGAAPVQWALINGEEETGVTTLFLVEKLDAGPVLLHRKMIIEPEDTAEILGRRLSNVGAQLLLETLEGLSSGDLDPVPQKETQVTLAPPLKKEDGLIDWERKAGALWHQIRGVTPWPGAYTFWRGKRLKIHQVRKIAAKRQAKPGEVLDATPEGLEIACGQGALLLKEVQLEGGKRMEIETFLKGHDLKTGAFLGA